LRSRFLFNLSAITLNNTAIINIRRPTPVNLNLSFYNCLKSFTKFLILALAWPNIRPAIANIIAIALNWSAIIAKKPLINIAI